jgi:hypothetical protein
MSSKEKKSISVIHYKITFNEPTTKITEWIPPKETSAGPTVTFN